MSKRVVDILVESDLSGYFVALKSDGIEIERRRFTTEQEARRVAEELSDMARRQGLVKIKSSAGKPK
jgi:hypothetical protein